MSGLSAFTVSLRCTFPQAKRMNDCLSL